MKKLLKLARFGGNRIAAFGSGIRTDGYYLVGFLKRR